MSWLRWREEDETRPVVYTADTIAWTAPAGTGLSIMAAQAANAVLRHCKIGRVIEKSKT